MKRALLLTAFLLGLASPADAAVTATDRTVLGAHVRVLAVPLREAGTVLDLVLADPGAGAHAPTGDAPFASLVDRAHAAALVNGTYFSMDARRSVMGTMVRAGRLVNHVAFRPRGTTFGLRAGNVPEMGPADQADWRSHWLSVTAGPRLLTDGRVTLAPRQEGFYDPSVLGTATRTALGTSQGGATLYLVSFHTPVGLAREAAVMRALGAYQAMSLDGGTCRALAEHGKPLVRPGRALTNAIAVYDAGTPAPAALAAAFQRFSRNDEAPAPLVVGGRRFDCGPFACGRRTPDVAVLTRPYDFEGWLFTRAAGRPVVHNRDGWLEPTPGSGTLRTRWAGTPTRFTVLTRLTGPSLALGLGDVRLEMTAGRCTLVRGGRTVASAAYPFGTARHLLTIDWPPGRIRVAVDRHTLLEAPATGRPGGLTLAGAGAYQGFGLAGR